MRMGCVTPLASRAKLIILLRRRAGTALAPNQTKAQPQIQAIRLPLHGVIILPRRRAITALTTDQDEKTNSDQPPIRVIRCPADGAIISQRSDQPIAYYLDDAVSQAGLRSVHCD